MSIKSDNQRTEEVNLGSMGLSVDESRLYTTLLQSGSMSVSQASDRLGIPRTTVYRVYETLVDKGLAKTGNGRRGLRLEALAPRAFEKLLRDRQAELDAQRQTLPQLLGALTNLVGNNLLGSRVTYYDGVDGLKQVTLNTLDAQDEILVYEIESMSTFLGQETAEEIRAETARREIHTRQLTNLRNIKPWTKTDVSKFLECRYLDPAELRMQFEVVIYNDVFCTYTYEEGDVFCVEIRSRDLVTMQRQLFEFVWNRARPMRRAGAGGAMRLVSDK